MLRVGVLDDGGQRPPGAPPFRGRQRTHTLKILLYLALISSLIFSTAAASSFMVLISRNGVRPGFSLVPGCIERRPPVSMMSCCASGENEKLWNSRAAFGFGAALKIAFGPMISGEPSVA